MVASSAAGTGRARLRARDAEIAPARPLTRRPPERNGTKASQADLTARIVSTAAWVDLRGQAAGHAGPGR